MLTLRKKIPARVKTLSATWCKKKFMEMSPQHRAIRSRSRNPIDKCYWCNKEFVDGDMMALACFTERLGNKTLCQICAEALLRSEDKEDGDHEAH